MNVQSRFSNFHGKLASFLNVSLILFGRLFPEFRCVDLMFMDGIKSASALFYGDELPSTFDLIKLLYLAMFLFFRRGISRDNIEATHPLPEHVDDYFSDGTYQYR